MAEDETGVAVASSDETDDAVVSAACVSQVFGDRADLAWRYHELLATRGTEWGLLGPREAGRLWSRHILNSAALAGLIPSGAAVLDVGSGAGLPGIPLAIARPDLSVTLLDSLLRRVTFLQQAVDELGLGGQVLVRRARAEETSRRYDVVVARAVAPLTKLVGWCEPLVGASGVLLALKGDGAEAEVKASATVLRRRALTARVVVLDAGPGVPPATAVEVVRL